MGMRKQYENLYLEPGDLTRLRDVRVMSVLAESGNPSMNLVDASRHLIAELEFLFELRQKYQIPPEDGVGFSLVDGMVVEIEDEI
jgi:hypothetical protein